MLGCVTGLVNLKWLPTQARLSGPLSKRNDKPPTVNLPSTSSRRPRPRRIKLQVPYDNRQKSRPPPKKDIALLKKIFGLILFHSTNFFYKFTKLFPTTATYQPKLHMVRVVLT